MVRRRGSRFRLAPSPAGDRRLTTVGGHARAVWNQALACNRHRLAQGVPLLGYDDVAGLLRFWKGTNERGFLAGAPSHPFQPRWRDLARAFHEAFEPTQPLKHLPTFKKRGRDDTRRFPRAWRFAATASTCPSAAG